MRYSNFEIPQIDFVSLYCLICMIVHDLNGRNTVFSQLMSLIPDNEFKNCIDRYVEGGYARRFTIPKENDFTLEAITTAEFYRESRIFETFFKWIKQHLHIKTYNGTFQNTVITQIWNAICDYLLIIIAQNRYYIEQNLYVFSSAIGWELFGKTPLSELLDKTIFNKNPEEDCLLLLW